MHHVVMKSRSLYKVIRLLVGGILFGKYFCHEYDNSAASLAFAAVVISMYKAMSQGVLLFLGLSCFF